MILLAPVASASPTTFDLSGAGEVEVEGDASVRLTSPAGFWVGQGGGGGAFLARSGKLSLYSWRESALGVDGSGAYNSLEDADREDVPLDRVAFELRVAPQDDGGVVFISEDTVVLAGRASGSRAPQMAAAANEGNPLPVETPRVTPFTIPSVEWTWEEGDLLVGNMSLPGYDVRGLPGLEAPTLRLNGTAVLAIHDGTLVLAGREVELGNWTEDGTPAGPGGSGIRRRVLAVIEIDGEVALALPPSFALGGSHVEVALEGRALWPAATGQFTADGVTYQVSGEAVDLAGSFSFGVDPTSAATAALPTRYSGEGELTSARIEGRLVWRAPQQVLAPELRASVAIALGALLVLALKIIGILYTRIRSDELLEHPRRRGIYETVLAHPGIHFRELHRASGGAYGPFLFHIRLLSEGGYLRSERRGRYRQVFATVSPPGATSGAPAIPNPVARAVFAALAEGAVRPGDVAVRLGVSRQLASYHLQRLEKAGLVRRDGRGFERTL